MLSLRSYGFVGKVGGVAFEGVAEPSEAIDGTKLSLSYDPKRPDGRRLSVVIEETAYEMLIADWKLKPITLFADSPYTSVISLFGEGPDRDQFYYIQYHESFQNTLLGLRLLQADIILMDLEHHWKLPKWNGSVVLGLGETVTDRNKAKQAASRLRNTLKDYKWRSWVLTDIGTTASIDVNSGELSIKASPYYYFWNTSEDVKAAHKTISEKHNQIVADIRVRQKAHNERVDVYRKEISSYNAMVRRINSSTDPAERKNLKVELGGKMTTIRSLEGALENLKTEIKAMKQGLDNLRAQINDLPVEEVTRLTSAMKHQQADLLAYNPSVYHAYQQTAKFAAFFRYVKKVTGPEWRRFVEQMKGVDIMPEVQTPAAWARKTPVTELQQ